MFTVKQFLTSTQLLLFSVYSCIVLTSYGTSVTAEGGEFYNISLTNYNVTRRSGHVIKEIKHIPAIDTEIINVVNIPDDVRFIIVQTHAFQHTVTLSFNETLLQQFSINGSNIGLVQEIKNVEQGSTKFYLHNPNDVNVTVMVTLQAYSEDAPIPGGCNMEFQTEIAPYLILDFSESMVLVNSQPASAPVPPGKPPRCESQNVVYEMYHMHLPERDFSQQMYFDSLLKMMTVRNIQLYGKKVPDPMEGSRMRQIYSSYPGTGHVFAIIAKAGTSASAYVPALTYSCDGTFWSDSCEILNTTFSKVLCAVIFFLGLFVCFYGHQYFKTEMFLLGFLSGSLVFYILIALLTSFSGSVTIVFSVVLGMCSGVFWLGFWWFYGIPVCSVLLATMTLGFIVAGISVYAWLGDLEVMRNDLNFWMVYGCIILAVPILFSSVIHRANMISCAVLGAYAVIIPIDHYIGSNLKYIILNVIRRATVKDFRLAVIDPPFQGRDTVLCALWVGIATLGIVIQWYKHRGKPPFPPPPYLQRRERSRQTRLLQRFVATERTPLLSDESAAPSDPPLYSAPLLRDADNIPPPPASSKYFTYTIGQ